MEVLISMNNGVYTVLDTNKNQGTTYTYEELQKKPSILGTIHFGCNFICKPINIRDLGLIDGVESSKIYPEYKMIPNDYKVYDLSSQIQVLEYDNFSGNTLCLYTQGSYIQKATCGCVLSLLEYSCKGYEIHKKVALKFNNAVMLIKFSENYISIRSKVLNDCGYNIK